MLRLLPAVTQLLPMRAQFSHPTRLLRVKLDVAIQSVRILREVSLELPTGTIAGLIGRNGAGGHVAGCG